METTFVVERAIVEELNTTRRNERMATFPGSKLLQE